MRRVTILTALGLCGCNAAFGIGDLTYDGAGAGAGGTGGVDATGGTAGDDGDGGAPGPGGAGGMGGGSVPTLGDEGLIVRYFLDDATRGAMPAVAADASPNGLDLPVVYDAGLPMWAQWDGNLGVRWTDAAANGGPEVLVDGTPLATLDNAETATFEVVALIQGVDATTSRLFDVGVAMNTSLSLGSNMLGTFEARLEGVVVATWTLPDTRPQRRVHHLVLDVTADGGELFRLYVDGDVIPPSTTNFPGEPEIEIALGDHFAIGNRAGGNRSIDGLIGYAAVYDVAFDDARIQAHTARLLDSDDP